MEMEEEKQNTNIVNHFEKDSNCQVFNGPVSGCVFAMPGAVVKQYAGTHEKPSEDMLLTAELPDVLAQSELWGRLQEAGLVNGENQPVCSRTEAALIASELAERLNIAHKWKMFEALWHRKNMRGDYNAALEQKKSLKFQDRLKEILR